MESSLALNSSLGIKVVPRKEISPFLWACKNWIQNRWREIPLYVALAIRPWIKGLCVIHGETRLKVIRKDGTVVDLGIAGKHLVTTVGREEIVDAFTGTSVLSTFNYHGIGTGTNAAAAGDTALQTEITTSLNPDNTRATGTQSEPTSTSYRSVATNTVDGTVAVTEWGLFTQAATGGGQLFDRQVFTAVNLVSGDSIQTTYTLTVSAS